MIAFISINAHLLTVPPWDYNSIWDLQLEFRVEHSSGKFPGHPPTPSGSLGITGGRQEAVWKKKKQQFKGAVLEAGGTMVQGSFCESLVSPHSWPFSLPQGSKDTLNSKIKPTPSLASIWKEKLVSNLLGGEITDRIGHEK